MKTKSRDPTALTGQGADSLAGSHSEYPIKVVIVDDDANERLITRRALDGIGEIVCVGTYPSANEALTEIPKVRPQVVLMDISMPGVNGIECARRLKKLLPELVVI